MAGTELAWWCSGHGEPLGRFTGTGVPERCGLDKAVLMRVRVRMCACYVPRGLGPLRWRDHGGGHGEHIPASEASVGAHYGLELARMAVQWRGVAVCYLIVRSVCF